MLSLEDFIRTELFFFYSEYARFNKKYKLGLKRPAFISAGTSHCKSLVHTYYWLKKNNLVFTDLKPYSNKIDIVILNDQAEIISGVIVTSQAKLAKPLAILKELPSISEKYIIFTGRGKSFAWRPTIETEGVVVFNMCAHKLGVDSFFAGDK